MCNFASFVLTKDKVFWSETTDSHEGIIREFKLAQDGARGPNILRVEITPPKLIDWNNLGAWIYRIDQDIMPEWHDPKADEARAREALKNKSLKVGDSLDLSGCTGLKALPDDLKVGGYLNLSGCTGLKALPDNLKVSGYLNLPNHLKR